VTNKAQEKRNVMQYFLQDINIGNNLKTLRKRFGYSQSELVAKLQLMGSNMSRSTYSKIETGTRNIRISDFIALKQIYDVDFSEFFIGLLSE
jgi:transcriptional regulator with XRE-family HTH domain